MYVNMQSPSGGTVLEGYGTSLEDEIVEYWLFMVTVTLPLLFLISQHIASCSHHCRQELVPLSYIHHHNEQYQKPNFSLRCLYWVLCHEDE